MNRKADTWIVSGGDETQSQYFLSLHYLFLICRRKFKINSPQRKRTHGYCMRQWFILRAGAKCTLFPVTLLWMMFTKIHNIFCIKFKRKFSLLFSCQEAVISSFSKGRTWGFYRLSNFSNVTTNRKGQYSNKYLFSSTLNIKHSSKTKFWKHMPFYPIPICYIWQYLCHGSGL